MREELFGSTKNTKHLIRDDILIKVGSSGNYFKKEIYTFLGIDISHTVYITNLLSNPFLII